MKSKKEKTQKTIKNFDALSAKKLITVKGGAQGVSTFDLVL